MRAIVVFDIDGVVRDVSGSYRRALADTVEYFTAGAYRPTPVDIDQLKSEGLWNNDWDASEELIYRYFETNGSKRQQLQLDYKAIVAFFQSRYRGPDPNNWTGYICNEPLLLQPSYLEQLTLAGIRWGFFSGATRASATYVLEKRLGLKSPVLVAMEDAPGKPDPTGLFAAVNLIDHRSTRSRVEFENIPTVSLSSEAENELDKLPTVIYAGDTVADMYTVQKARLLQPSRTWVGVGILPPHVLETPQRRDAYAETLSKAGAAVVLSAIEELTPLKIQKLE